jgi:hypothetical protein
MGRTTEYKTNKIILLRKSVSLNQDVRGVFNFGYEKGGIEIVETENVTPTPGRPAKSNISSWTIQPRDFHRAVTKNVVAPHSIKI